MDCNRFLFSPVLWRRQHVENTHLEHTRAHIGNRHWGRKNTGLVHKEQLCGSGPKKKPKNSIMLLAWRCHVWTRWLRARWRACSAAHYRTLEVTSKKKEKKRKMRHLFNLQMIVPSSLRLKGALWSVERATRGACLLADGLLLDGLIMVERRN